MQVYTVFGREPMPELHLEPRAHKIEQLPPSWNFSIPKVNGMAPASSSSWARPGWWMIAFALLIVWGGVEVVFDVDDLFSPLLICAAVTVGVAVRGYNFLSRRRQEFARARRQWVLENAQPPRA